MGPSPAVSILALTSLLSLYGNHLVVANDWCYDEKVCGEKAKWGGDCSGGSVQSPIDIPTARLKSHNDEVMRTMFSTAWCETQDGFYLRNSQHSVELRIAPDGNSEDLRMRGVGFLGRYYFAQAHFHWGVNGAGSEHSVNKARYSMEIHLVHLKFRQYPSSSNYSQHNIAVLGIFVDADPSYPPNPAIQPIVDVIVQASKTAAEEVVYFAKIPINLSLFLPQNKKVYRYMGSLTTPPCSEQAIWTVFAEPIRISMDQLETFRKLESDGGDNLSNNFRPVQPANGRDVFEHTLSTNCKAAELPKASYKKEVGKKIRLQAPNKVPLSRSAGRMENDTLTTSPKALDE